MPAPSRELLSHNAVAGDTVTPMPLRVIDEIELRDLIGREVAVGDWFQVQQERIDRFADVTEDRQWIHTDPGRAARESPYATTVAHGFLTLSLLSHLVHQAVRVRGAFSRAINYGLNRVRFPAPVPAGARVRGRVLLRGVEDIDGALQMVWEVTVEVEGSAKPACVAEWVLRWYR
jgi:acyl dehydratase